MVKMAISSPVPQQQGLIDINTIMIFLLTLVYN